MADPTSDAARPTARWDDALLDPFRQRADPLADDIVAAIFARDGADGVRRLAPALSAATASGAALPAEVMAYLSSTDVAVERDPRVVSIGESVFEAHGPEILMVLCCYSLPAAYAARKGVQVLHRTAYLAKRPNRRLFETTQMIVDVMTPGGLLPEGRGLRAARRVRLMHAAVRHLVQHDPSQGWNAADLGLPINQEDMAGTLMTFSWLILDGLQKLGIDIPDVERNAYLDAWITVGRLMGVDEALLPATVDEARALSDLIERRQVAPSPEGREMTEALLGMMRTNLAPGFRRCPDAMLRVFLPAAVANDLGIPSDPLDGVVDEVMSMAGHLDQLLLPDARRRSAYRAFSAHLIQWMLSVELDGRPASFALPDGLADAWHLAPAGSESGFWHKLYEWWRHRLQPS